MIIYIDGPINSGKTTLSKLLLAKIPKAVHIEIDQIRHIACKLSLIEAIPYALEDALHLTQNWIKRGYHVLISWPITKMHYQRFVELSKLNQVGLYSFTLLPDIETCTSQHRGRTLTNWEKNRILDMYNTLYKHGYVGYKIDTGTLAPEVCVDIILSRISMKINKQ